MQPKEKGCKVGNRGSMFVKATKPVPKGAKPQVKKGGDLRAR